MITRSSKRRPIASWQAQLRDAYRDPRELLADLGLDPESLGLGAKAAEHFPFLVTRAFASRMQPGDVNDPLLLQVLPHAAELSSAPGFSDDPVGEFSLGENSSVLRKYSGRALVLASSSCAINCRYCFRRNYPYEAHRGSDALENGLAELRADTSINEVILSGGDPLVLSDAKLDQYLTRLADIGHLRRLRIHSRLPIVLPDRLTAALLRMLSRQRFEAVMVVHCNHPQELDASTLEGLRRMRDAGITVLNQAVLLHRVNDDAEVLATLGERLFSAGTLPYYLHLLDRVSGTAHFDLNESRISQLQRELRARVPGYLMPRFVRELAGGDAKTPFG